MGYPPPPPRSLDLLYSPCWPKRYLYSRNTRNARYDTQVALFGNKKLKYILYKQYILVCILYFILQMSGGSRTDNPDLVENGCRSCFAIFFYFFLFTCIRVVHGVCFVSSGLPLVYIFFSSRDHFLGGDVYVPCQLSGVAEKKRVSKCSAPLRHLSPHTYSMR